ncbi:MAG TPA: hypothetical protein VKG82_00290 [Solirubrobacteraceae bacterium]|nr:hypothetical protein [Solirubrobacteraceae bacterium]
MEARFSDVLQSYNALSSSLLERWSTLANRSASRLDAGSFDPGSAVQDTVAGAKLVTEAAWLWTGWWWESVANLCGLEGQPKIAESQPFYSPDEGATLKLAGPLMKGPGMAQLAAPVSIEPAQLDPEDTEFKLRVDGTGCRAGTYVGKVTATTEKGPKEVVVWITIP